MNGYNFLIVSNYAISNRNSFFLNLNADAIKFRRKDAASQISIAAGKEKNIGNLK